MHEAMNENSLALIMLREWAPTVFTIVFGGLFASIVIPIWQDRFNRSRALVDRKIILAERIAADFQQYITSWRRLIQISEFERQKGSLTAAESDRKGDFVKQRNDSRDSLFEGFSVLRIHYSPATVDKVEKFIQWDETKTIAELSNLPKISEWSVWKDNILASMKREMEK